MIYTWCFIGVLITNTIIFMKWIEAHVTQGDEKVEDAKKVEFELWKSDQESHEKVLGKHQGNGFYSISQTFQEDGEYTVIAHVTARDMHNMPKKEFSVTKTAE
jgi:predicted transcriptional regulator YdeE